MKLPPSAAVPKRNVVCAEAARAPKATSGTDARNPRRFNNLMMVLVGADRSVVNARTSSRPDPGSLYLQSLCTIHQIDLECQVLRCIIGIGLGSHADLAIAQPPLQRAQG